MLLRKWICWLKRHFWHFYNGNVAVDGAQLYYGCDRCGLAINEVRNWQQQSKQTPLSFDRIVFFEGIGIHDESCMHDTCHWHTRAFQRAYRSAGDVELTNFSGGKFRTVHSI